MIWQNQIKMRNHIFVMKPSFFHFSLDVFSYYHFLTHTQKGANPKGIKLKIVNVCPVMTSFVEKFKSVGKPPWNYDAETYYWNGKIPV